MNVAPLTFEGVAPAERFDDIAIECRRFARRASMLLDSLLDGPSIGGVVEQKWSIIDDMLIDLHEACDNISPETRRKA